MRSFGIQQFGQLAPDQPSFGTVHTESARNCLPRSFGYVPLQEFAPFTTPVPERAVGAFTASDYQRNSYNFIGTTASIYQGDGVGGWTDVGAGGYNPAERWEFAVFGNQVIAVSLENIQQILTLGGAAFAPQTDIQARHIAVVRQQVMCGNTKDSTDNERPNRVRWSALNDPTDWTPSQETLSGFADLESTDGGEVVRVLGGEFAIVFLERSIWRGTFTGSSTLAYQWDEVDKGARLFGPSSVIRHDGLAFYLSEDGFRVTNGGQSRPIGEERIDNAVLRDLDETYAGRISGMVLEDEQTLMWAYPGAGNIGGSPNRLVLYNHGANRWAFGDDALQILINFRVPFTSPDSLDSIYASLEDVPGSFDDLIWTGGALSSGAVLLDGTAAFLNGPQRTATFKTHEMQHTPGRRTFVSEVRPVIEGGNVTVSVGYRDSLSEGMQATAFSTSNQPNEVGVVETRVDARYTSYSVTVAPPYESVVGLEPFGEPSGGR